MLHHSITLSNDMMLLVELFKRYRLKLWPSPNCPFWFHGKKKNTHFSSFILLFDQMFVKSLLRHAIYQEKRPMAPFEYSSNQSCVVCLQYLFMWTRCGNDLWKQILKCRISTFITLGRYLGNSPCMIWKGVVYVAETLCWHIRTMYYFR